MIHVSMCIYTHTYTYAYIGKRAYLETYLATF